MAAPYYMVLTEAGEQLEADALANNNSVTLDTMVVGDGGGSTYYDNYDRTALKALTSLVNQVDSLSLNDLRISPDADNEVVAEAIIDINNGPYTIREVGVLTPGGDLFAVGRFPEADIPGPSEGAPTTMLIRTLIRVTDTDSVTFNAAAEQFLVADQNLGDVNDVVAARSNLLIDQDLQAIDEDFRRARLYAYFTGGF